MTKKRTQAQKEADKRRTGRPPKAASARRSHKITVYLDDEELARISTQAQTDGLSLAEMIMAPWRQKER